MRIWINFSNAEFYKYFSKYSVFGETSFGETVNGNRACFGWIQLFFFSKYNISFWPIKGNFMWFYNLNLVHMIISQTLADHEDWKVLKSTVKLQAVPAFWASSLKNVEQPEYMCVCKMLRSQPCKELVKRVSGRWEASSRLSENSFWIKKWKHVSNTKNHAHSRHGIEMLLENNTYRVT